MPKLKLVQTFDPIDDWTYYPPTQAELMSRIGEKVAKKILLSDTVQVYTDGKHQYIRTSSDRKLRRITNGFYHYLNRAAHREQGHRPREVELENPEQGQYMSMYGLQVLYKNNKVLKGRHANQLTTYYIPIKRWL